MKKEIFIHFSFLVSFFLLISVVKNWFDASYLMFWVGGLVGTVLPDLDHIIYIYLLRPNEFVAQRAAHMVRSGKLWESLNYLAETRYERTKLIFHTASFHIIFLVLSFLVLTSSGSVFGRGLVLSFLLHLVVDQFVDMTKMGSLSNWLPGNFKSGQIYFYLGIFSLLIFGFLL